MSIETWMPTLAKKLSELPKMQAVHYPGDDPQADIPASLSQFPCIVILPRVGDEDYGASGPNISLHRIQITLFVAPQFLTEAMGRAVPYIALVRNKLAANVKLDGLVQEITPLNPGFYDGPGGIEYASKTHTGIKFNYQVKESDNSFPVQP